MKRFMTISLVISAVLLLALALPAGASTSHPFRGNWKGTDTYDQSNLTLWIVEEARSGGSVFEIRGHDDRTGPWCGGQAKMRGLGVLEDDSSIAVSMVWWCLPAGSNILYFLSDTLTYDSSTDTVSDTTGVIYSRQR
jgi:hypothetical protein